MMPNDQYSRLNKRNSKRTLHAEICPDLFAPANRHAELRTKTLRALSYILILRLQGNSWNFLTDRRNFACDI
jgi:hypothetical protein